MIKLWTWHKPQDVNSNIIGCNRRGQTPSDNTSPFSTCEFIVIIVIVIISIIINIVVLVIIILVISLWHTIIITITITDITDKKEIGILAQLCRLSQYPINRETWYSHVLITCGPHHRIRITIIRIIINHIKSLQNDYQASSSHLLTASWAISLLPSLPCLHIFEVLTMLTMMMIVMMTTIATLDNL